MTENKWKAMRDAPRDGKLILLLLGDTIPDLPNIRGGSFIDSTECAELGYEDFRYGGWMIWNDGSDWFVLDNEEPEAWYPAPI